jgi:predicted DNA-binding transcriptional regulator YafY
MPYPSSFKYFFVMARNDAERIKRIFRLITCLKETQGHTAKQLAESFGVSVKSIYRDIKFLEEELEYEIDQRGSAYFLFETFPKLIFDAKELNLLHKLLSSDNTNAVARGIRSKLKMAASAYPTAEEIAQHQMAKNIERLQMAIDDQRPVKLIRYVSSNPETGTADRKVWPLHIVDDSAQLVAFEVKGNIQKNYKLPRIGEVMVLPAEKNKPAAVAHETDVFGWTGKKAHLVELNLSTRAWLLMKEEFPRAIPFLSARKNKEFPYCFKGNVYDFNGIRRFIMGLPGEIEVKGPEELRGYLKKCIQEYLFPNR